jgi:hypothetical protein
MALPYADLLIAADTDVVVQALLAALGPPAKPSLYAKALRYRSPGTIGVSASRERSAAVRDRTAVLTHLPISWTSWWDSATRLTILAPTAAALRWRARHVRRCGAGAQR